MDPRPYHYEYRRPRLNNPTYESINLFESLYHRGHLNRYENHNQLGTFQPKNEFQKQIYSNSILANKSMNNKNAKSVQGNLQVRQNSAKLQNPVVTNFQTESYQNRPTSNGLSQIRHSHQVQQKNSVLASYGKSTMPNQKPPLSLRHEDARIDEKLNQFTVYKKQQKPYNIIGNLPRSISSELREYPKYTLEHKLIEQGKYFPK